MNAPFAPAILLDAVKRARLQRRAESSLIDFTQQAWDIIEPGVEFKDNWHLHAIAEHLEAVSAGEIEYLVINIPPGCMKSILVSVAWPAWEWLADPRLRYLGGSYGGDLAIRDAQKSRDIITSAWYQERWPHVKVRKGADQKLKYELTGGGWRIATSVGGRATGEHPDRKIIDDPHSAAQADSDAERLRALVWHDRTLSSRGVSRGARTVLVMQRLHERDMTGHVLATNPDVVHLCLPMEYDQIRRTTVLGWTDPRHEANDLLWENLFDRASVDKLKRSLGEYGTAGQLQQTPSPAGGGILKTSHFQMWPAKKELPLFDTIVQSYDGAYSEDNHDNNDPTACTVWGLFEHAGRRGALLLDAWSEYYAYPKFRQRVVEDWHSTYGKNKYSKGKKPDIILVEKKSSGISILQDLQQANIPAVSYDPGRANKIMRAHNVAPIVELDCIYILESTKDPGQFVSWARPFVSQVNKFPNDEHDDYVDTFTQAMIYSRDSGYFELEVAPPDEEEPVDYGAQRAENPYG